MAKLSDWLHNKRSEVIRKWKNNEIGLADAAAELYRLGVPAPKAWAMLEKL